MEKIWTAYDEDAGKYVSIDEPELVTLANGQKAVMGESAETGKLLYRMISSEEATTYFGKQKA